MLYNNRSLCYNVLCWAKLFFCLFMGFPGGSIVNNLLQGGKQQEGDDEMDKVVQNTKKG